MSLATALCRSVSRTLELISNHFFAWTPCVPLGDRSPLHFQKAPPADPHKPCIRHCSKMIVPFVRKVNTPRLSHPDMFPTARVVGRSCMERKIQARRLGKVGSLPKWKEPENLQKIGNGKDGRTCFMVVQTANI